METIEIIGYKRANLGKQNSKKLREEGNVPCVVYGGKEQIHFHSPMILFRDLVYTPGANFVKLNIEGVEKDAILQDIQFHPVSETILHADFLELQDDKKVKMEIPVKIIGNSPNAIRLGLEAYDKITKTDGEQQYLMDMLQKTIMSKDAQEGINAFKEKRNPVWTGE